MFCAIGLDDFFNGRMEVATAYAFEVGSIPVILNDGGFGSLSQAKREAKKNAGDGKQVFSHGRSREYSGPIQNSMVTDFARFTRISEGKICLKIADWTSLD